MSKLKLFFLLLFTFAFLLLPFAYAACEVKDYDNVEEYQKVIAECQEEINARMDAHSKNKVELVALESQVENLKNLMTAAEARLNSLEKEIFNSEVDLGYQKELFDLRVRDYYIHSRRYSPFLLFLSSANAADLMRELAYRQTVAGRDKQLIIEISQNLKKLITDKEAVAANKNWLAQTKTGVSNQAEVLRKEVEKVEGFFSEVSGKIAVLSAKQEALLTAKVETFTTSVGEVPLADDPNSRPDFNPGFSPAFAGFSFGAPHRKGMSQYGALGRSKSGQSYEEILRAYYGDVRVEKRDWSATIATSVGDFDFESNYLMGIAEMPSSWADEGGFEALKAQAVAARSYAIRAGKPICVTEACQVYRSSKAASPPDSWRRAVEDTRAVVVVSNQTNEVVSTWYASTAGGYVYGYSSVGHTTPGIWDTSCGSKDCWTGEAWEKKAGSPWFYKGWYKSRAGTSCGRSHPWLTQEEMADILNSVIVYQSGEGTEHILPEDYGSCFGGGEPWSKEEMKNQAGKHGGAITSVSSVNVLYGSDGKTASVVFGTNRGNFSLSGEEFKTIFNLRAPGRIVIKSALFNIEKK